MPAVGLFRTSRAETPKVTASVGASTTPTSAVSALLAASGYAVGRERAMRIPTISRARDLICSMVGSLDLEHVLETWTGDTRTETVLRPEPWMVRPEKRCPRSVTMTWTTDDLMFLGRAHWRVSARRAVDGRPYGFERLPAASVMIEADAYAGTVPMGEYRLTYNGQTLEPNDVVSFWSPIEPLLRTAARSLFLAERLDQAATRYAVSPVAFGWLKQIGGEPLSADELDELAASWDDARTSPDAVTAALNEFIEYHESQMSPDRLQLTESREYAAKELGRLANAPGYLLNIDQSGMTYANAQQSRQDLWLFGAAPYGRAIIEQLSSDQVLPRDHYVRFELAELALDSRPTPATPAPRGA